MIEKQKLPMFYEKPIIELAEQNLIVSFSDPPLKREKRQRVQKRSKQITCKKTPAYFCL